MNRTDLETYSRALAGLLDCHLILQERHGSLEEIGISIGKREIDTAVRGLVMNISAFL